MASNPVATSSSNAERNTGIGARRARAVLIASVVLQTVTGFGPLLTRGEVSGWPLLAHMFGAPLFLIGLTGVALLWTQRSTFAAQDGGLQRLSKLLYWIVLLAGIGTTFSMLIAMLPAYGHEQQVALIVLHKYSALAMLLAAVFMTLAAWAARGMQR